jgi:hypothetical protein
MCPREGKTLQSAFQASVHPKWARAPAASEAEIEGFACDGGSIGGSGALGRLSAAVGGVFQFSIFGLLSVRRIAGGWLLWCRSDLPGGVLAAHEMFCLRLGNALREGRNSPLPKLNFRHLRRPSSADNSSPTQSSERSHPKKMYSDERISGDANTGSKLPEDGKLVCVTHSGIYCAYIGKVTRHEDSQHDV